MMSKQGFSISPHSNTMRSGTSESDHVQNPNPNPNPPKKKRNLPGTPGKLYCEVYLFLGD